MTPESLKPCLCHRGDGVQQEWSLTQFYDADGILHDNIFKAEVQRLVARCERQEKRVT